MKSAEACLACITILPAISLAQQVVIAEYPIGSPACAVTAGPDGALWFTEENTIGRITTSGLVTEYLLPTVNDVLLTVPVANCGIVTGPDGALWFTETLADKVGRITTSGAITEYSVPTAGDPWGIAAGSDGALWFAEYIGNQIGRITTAGAITMYPMPTHDPNGPFQITAGPDGALWFTNSDAQIGRITTAGAITVYPAPPKASLPYYITTGPDGALWFTEDNAGQIGRIDTAGVVTHYPLRNPKSQPTGIAVGPDGALWFAEYRANKIGRITTAGAITEYPIPTAGSAVLECRPLQMTLGPDGNLWFAERESPAIGQVVITSANLSVSPDSGYYRSDLTFAGSGFAPGEPVQVYYQGVGSRVLANPTADAGGSISATAQAPESPYGPRAFLAKGMRSGNVGAVNFSAAAHLSAQPDAGQAGSTVTLVGYGFGSREWVSVYWNDRTTFLGNVQADLHGTFAGSGAFTFTVPSEASAGDYHIIGHGLTSRAIGSGSFTVE